MIKGEKRKGLIIGISDYSSLQQLDFCKKDGQEVYTILTSLGYEISDNYKLIGEVKGERIRDAIYDFFTDINTNPDDTIFFYYSGHGVPDFDGDTYLASSDINPDEPFRRGFSFEELTKMMQKSISTRVVAILDCCYSGKAKLSKGHEDDAAKLARIAIDEKLRKLPQGQGKYLLAASQAAQEAYALATSDHSIFTYYLLQGLKGNAESVDAQGNVTVGTLGRYIYRSMMNLPANRRPKQAPLIRAEVAGDIILASYPRLAKKIEYGLSQSTPEQAASQSTPEQAASQSTPEQAASQSTPEQAAAQSGPSPHILTDSWTLDDALGYRVYAHAIARFITHPKTSTPLCISIQAPWGQGKTSLMRMVQEELDDNAVKEFSKETTSTQLQRKLKQEGVKLEQIVHKPEDLWENTRQEEFKSLNVQGNEEEEVKPCVTIWFNAWAYENTEQVWSGLADSIVQQIAERLEKPEESTRFLLRLHIRRHGADTIARRIYNRISSYSKQKSRPWELGSLLGIGASATLVIIQRLEDSKAFPVVGLGGIVVSVALGISMALLQRYAAKSTVKNEPVRESLGEYVDIPDYRNRSVFMSNVIEDVQSVIESIPKKYRPIVIFIDDLDRCSPNKVVNVIEAINLFLGGGYFSDCIFVIGMDAEMVAAALEKSYSKVITHLQDNTTRTGIGWRFMDKFVQLPLAIPSPDKKNINKYIEMIFLQDRLKAKKSRESEQNVKEAKNNENSNAERMNNVINEQKDVELDESKLSEHELEQHTNIQDLNKMINDFSAEEDPKMHNLILKYAPQFSTNPRDVKRFMNVFRFQYFILLASRAQGLSAPTDEQLAHWIVLSLKWPGLVRWLQSDPLHRLKQLENLGRTCKDNNEWNRKMKSEVQLRSDIFHWITDEEIRFFFMEEGKRNEEERLSACMEKGLY